MQYGGVSSKKEMYLPARAWRGWRRAKIGAARTTLLGLLLFLDVVTRLEGNANNKRSPKFSHPFTIYSYLFFFSLHDYTF